VTGPAEWLRLVVAAALGAVVGLERELAGQPAGLRTHALVALGSALFTVVGLTFTQPETDGEAARIVAAIVTGIGFLGAGTIVRAGGTVLGLTTAASLWATAAVGLAAGSGFYLLALVSVGLIIAVLRGLNWLRDLLHGKAPTDKR
jgi:putative Mg2+ transporter-C (MgtC) family protein